MAPGSTGMNISSELVSFNPWKVWLFPFLQYAAILVNGPKSLWERLGDRFTGKFYKYTDPLLKVT